MAILSLATALLGAGCGDDDGGGSGSPDAPADAATPGGGSTGAVTQDAGTSNQQPTPPQDAAVPSTGTADGGTSDAGTPGDGGAALGDAGTFFAEVKANGTGCPPGSWSVQLSADKQSFTIAFSKYDAEVTPQTTASIKDCQLAIKLRSRAPVSYAVQTFAFDGYAKLERGVNAQLTANYYFQGNPANSIGQEVKVDGPYDKPFSFRQNVGLPEQVWSACAIERDLNLTSRVVLKNGMPAASGRVNIAQSSGGPQLFVALAQRACP
ncbi:MAG: DUF4360 domain-containing protein [Polyangiales bacterium]